MNPEIFRAYDIRGKYPIELNEELAYKIGVAVAEYLKAKEIVIGRDMRLSSPSLFKSLTEGITDIGINVIDIGMVSTPMVYFGVANYGYSGGIMITASHNPKEDNGFKICREQAKPVCDIEIDKIRQLVENEMTSPIKKEKRGEIIIKSILKDYKRHVLKFVTEIKNLKVVIDASNGMAGCLIPELFKNLNIEIIPLYFELDGSFPNHEPNPLKAENMKDLQKKVLEQKADLGIAFDGDADRVIFVDEQGEIVRADFINALISLEFLKRNPKSTTVYDLRSSKIVKKVVESNGGKAVMSQVGHAFVKKVMREENGIFGGELSGHYYFRDNFYADNADITSIELMNLLSSANKRLSKLLKPLKIYYPSGEINSEVEDKEAKLKEIEEIYHDGKISYIDGILVEYEDWWFNLRPSNTESLLRLNLEANTKEKMEKYRDRLLAQIRK